jgi:hypothetical protein
MLMLQNRCGKDSSGRGAVARDNTVENVMCCVSYISGSSLVPTTSTGFIWASHKAYAKGGSHALSNIVEG